MIKKNECLLEKHQHEITKNVLLIACILWEKLCQITYVNVDGRVCEKWIECFVWNQRCCIWWQTKEKNSSNAAFKSISFLSLLFFLSQILMKINHLSSITNIQSRIKVNRTLSSASIDYHFVFNRREKNPTTTLKTKKKVNDIERT